MKTDRKVLVNELSPSKLRGIKSVIPARPVGATLSEDSHRESFCIKEGFPASGNDTMDKNKLVCCPINNFAQVVIPAEAGIQYHCFWIPVCTGMTKENNV